MSHRIFGKLKTALELLLMTSLLLMVAITFADVLGRHLFNHPIFGIHDLTEHLMALTVFCGLPMVTIAGLHLCVDLLDRYLQHPLMQWWHHLTAILIAAIMLIIAVTFFQSAMEAREINDVSNELRLPRGPLYLLMSFSALISGIGLLYQHFVAKEALFSLPNTDTEL